MKVVALKAWSNGSYSMEEKSVADIPDDLAEELIAAGAVAESPDYYGGGGDQGGPLIITEHYSGGGYVLSATWQEIYDALATKGVVFEQQYSRCIVELASKINNSSYKVFMGTSTHKAYEASNPNGYPANYD